MDAGRHIYDTEEERKRLLADPEADTAAVEAKLREDVARLDGYLHARAEADAPKRRPNADLTHRRSDG